ncbi:methyltransferase domain-containing protein [Gloeocapsopsis sp. IPPAS B-1203]|uniref:methyltransferase domain-containing protein n=1 Tax=Gloeocapsopsis sp. IPPAS B-1203 TaxID=2049454 RepID=UPI000C1A34B9|nr:methyltransferase domain-containing protein [Gloeocapsopsis sp. IPPAS B-1203]PIG94933.1 methyltransferase type 11 [Gloeocapsopsis sp. IPPAS B-1203]
MKLKTLTAPVSTLARKLNLLASTTNKPATSTASVESDLRQQIAAKYLTGHGIEIGALHSPLQVPAEVNIQYVDRISVEELRQQYPELAAHNLVEPDIIDDGEVLTTVPNDSLDFVIVNHVIEHCQNPIFSLENWLRVLKPGGVLYMAVPDKRYTFDCDRPITPLEHIIRDYEEGGSWSERSHYEEWARLVEKAADSNVATRAENLLAINYSIHFHVWTQIEFLELLLYCRNSLSLPLEIELLQKNQIEFIVILRKTMESLQIQK